MTIKSKIEHALKLAKGLYETGGYTQTGAVIMALKDLRTNCTIHELDVVMAKLIERVLFPKVCCPITHEEGIKSLKAKRALAYAKKKYETGAASRDIATVNVLHNLKVVCNVSEFQEALAYFVYRVLFSET